MVSPKKTIGGLGHLLMILVRFITFVTLPFTIALLCTALIGCVTAATAFVFAATFLIYKFLYELIFRRQTHDTLKLYKEYLFYHSGKQHATNDCVLCQIDWNAKSAGAELHTAFEWVLGEKSLKDIVQGIGIISSNR